MTTPIKCRFEIEDVVSYKDGVCLMGKCTEGTIGLGDVFIWALRRQVEPGENHSFTIHKEKIGEIHLEVKEIQYFRMAVAQLQLYHSGALYVTGTGTELLGPSCEIENA